MKKRYAFIDVIRFISMAAIVYYHLIITLYLSGIRQLESVSHLYENNNMHIATVGVGLFFMISGAGLMLSTASEDRLNLKKYYLKRFIKVLVPFYVVYLMWLVAFMLLTGEGLSKIYTSGANPLAIIFTLLGMDAYISSFGIATFSLGIGEWFLGALVIIYLLFPLLRWGIRKSKWASLIIATVYFIIIIVIYPIFPFAQRVPGFVNVLCKIYEFFLGMWLITQIDRIPRWLCFAISIPLIGLFLFFPGSIPLNQNLMILIQNLSFFLLFVGLEGVFNKIPRVIKVISFLCGFSYEFYLVHHVIIEYMTLQHIGVPFPNADVLLLFLKELLVITLFAVLVKGILKAPSLIKAKLLVKKNER